MISRKLLSNKNRQAREQSMKVGDEDIFCISVLLQVTELLLHMLVVMLGGENCVCSYDGIYFIAST